MPNSAFAISSDGNIVTINPDSDLQWNTQYTISVSTALADTAGNNLAEIYQWSFTTRIDPNSIPPIVNGNDPVDGAINVFESTILSATFSKPMDLVSLQSAFTVPGVSGTVTYIHPTASFTPDADLDYNTTYNVSISTAAKDTFDINLAVQKNWTITTRANPNIPIISFLTPEDSTVIEDTITIFAQVGHPTGVDSIRFFVNSNHYITSTSLPSFWLDATLFPIGNGNRIHAIAYADPFMSYSDTLIIFQKWELLATDFDPIGGIPQELQKAFYRSTDSTLEFRFEFSANWVDPVNDTALNLAIFFDIDQSESTGRLTFGGNDLNDIGAEYRVIMGIDSDSAFTRYNPNTAHPWADLIYGLEGFTGIYLPENSSSLEFGLRWLDLENINFVDLIAVNAFSPEPGFPVFDWMPNEGAGHLTIKRNSHYVGPGVITPAAKLRSNMIPDDPPNPFN